MSVPKLLSGVKLALGLSVAKFLVGVVALIAMLALAYSYMASKPKKAKSQVEPKASKSKARKPKRRSTRR